MKGEFLSIPHPVECHCIPSPLPPITSSSKMVYVWLTDYVANSAAFVYQTAGVLEYTVTPDMVNTIISMHVVTLSVFVSQVPSDSPITLNTTSFKSFIPQVRFSINCINLPLNLHILHLTYNVTFFHFLLLFLLFILLPHLLISLLLQLYQKYPNMLMQLIIKAVKPPLVLVTPSDINITIPGSMVVQVIQPPNKTMQEAFELGVVSPTIKMTIMTLWIFSNLPLHFFPFYLLHFFIIL